MAEVVVIPKAFTKEWFGYVWDYYRYHILIGAAAIILAVFIIFQTVTAVKYDTNINFVAASVLEEDDAEKLADICEKNSNDINENGKVDIAVNQINFTKENEKSVEITMGLQEKLMALLNSPDEIVFIVDSKMLNTFEKMKYTEDIFYENSLLTDEEALKTGKYAVSLKESTGFKNIGIDGSDLYVLIARMDYDDSFTKEEENGIKIAQFLIK